MSPYRPEVDRFHDFVFPVTESGCWIWMAVLLPSGYGKFKARGTTMLAHRWAYEHFVGPIPKRLHLDHLCRVRCCVNPAHLEPVTPAENVRRGMRAQSTACPKGHEYTPENTIGRTDNNGRKCRMCQRAAGRDWYRRIGKETRQQNYVEMNASRRMRRKLVKMTGAQKMHKRRAA